MSGSILSTLKKIPLFSGLKDQELHIILGMCKASKANTQEKLFNEGDASHDLYILLSGSIELYTKKTGVIFTLQSCDIFGEIGLITQRTRSASARCLEECSLLSINHTDFNLLAGKQPRISSILMRNISTNLANHVVRMNHTSPGHIFNTKSHTKTEISPTKTSPQVLINSPG